ncbi:hypothetical protein MK851_14760 [Tenacibaculum sp. 1B UA]|uniref:hypothetical protein n=1 Tax=Tenacibaculum sp. 1B UA TaxID=2922252 RepID=UPI002A24AA51|nr:hypothetical protein [Tenacibaculum sp. 1B UA]MDX8554876.1 hypothetical protein [Tenacibaculum sp. 1B UA]
MKRISFFIILISIIFIQCKKEEKVDKTSINSERKYKFEKVILRYDLGNNNRRDVGAYVNEKDTVVFNEVQYKNGNIDTLNSLFYEIELDKKENSYSGRLVYYYDSIKEGKIDFISLNLIKKINNKREKMVFEKENSNVLEINFNYDNDTIMGVLFVRHFKDTIENGEKKLRMRERYFPVDNYEKTNNPFIGIKP